MLKLGRSWRRWTRRCRSRDDEAGAVLVIWVVALVGLMAMAAMAVDLGNIAQTKEHTETAVQDAVLSAVVDLQSLYPGGGGNAAAQEQQAVNAAEAYLEDNYAALKQAVAQNPNLFDTCTQLPTSYLYLWPTASCFGFFYPPDPASLALDQSNPTGMAVAIPTQSVAFSVGRAAGLQQQAVSSTAYAELETSLGRGGGLPFGYTLASSGASTGLQCLKTGSGKSLGTCTGFATGSGQFGLLNSPRYTILPEVANGGGQDPLLETDVAIGIDHSLTNSYYTAPPPPSPPPVQICDAASTPPSCTAYNNTPATYNTANWVSPQTGQTLSGDLQNGLFTGITNNPDCPTIAPRLNYTNGFNATPATSCSSYSQQTPSGPLLSTDSFNSNYPLNGTPIAAYLDSSSTEGAAALSACQSVQPAGFPSVAVDTGGIGSSNVWINYDGCLSSFIATLQPNPLSGVASADWLFSSSIVDSPRFGVVPILAGGGNGTNGVEIVGFADAYLDLGFPKGSGVGAVSAWIFPPSMVQPSDRPSPSPNPDYTGGPFTANLCSLAATACT